MKWHFTMQQRFFMKNFMKNLLLFLIPIMLIGPYGIYQLNRESREGLKKTSYNLFSQIDETMNSLLGELDNVYYYISSNPSIGTSLKAAYGEKEMSLSSIRSASSICALLRYYMYTSEYIEGIYVYYYNDNNRILMPEKGMMASLDAYPDLLWIEDTKNAETDIWMDSASVAHDKYGAPSPVLYYCRKMYSTINPSNTVGVIVVEYDAEALRKYIQAMALYEDHVIGIVGNGNQILVQNGTEDGNFSEIKQEL